MMTKRHLLSWIAFAVMLSLTGCNGCRRNCNSSGSYAPPPCCGPSSPPPGYVPPVTP